MATGSGEILDNENQKQNLFFFFLSLEKKKLNEDDDEKGLQKKQTTFSWNWVGPTFPLKEEKVGPRLSTHGHIVNANSISVHPRVCRGGQHNACKERPQQDRWYTCCGGYNHEPKGTSHYIFSHSHSVVGPNPIYVHVYTFPLVQGSTYWCHVSFPLVMGDLMISEEKEGSWKEQRWLKAKCM